VSYLVYCTFDLKYASSKDYENAYADLRKIGLARVVVSDGGENVVIPTTSVMGTFTGADIATVRNDIYNRVHAAFQARRLTAEIFIVVGTDWAWIAGTT